MQLYRTSAEIYLLVSALVAPVLCIYGWLLLGKMQSKRLRDYVHWYTPMIVANTLGAGGIIVQVCFSFFDRRDYLLASVPYFFYFASLPFHIAFFVRLWKTITRLPADPGHLPYLDRPEQEGNIWPPPPQR